MANVRKSKSNVNPSLENLGEWGLLHKILPRISKLNPRAYVVAPGDDAAILRKPNGLVISIDGLTEGTHFKTSWMQGFKKKYGFPFGRALGWKLMGSSLSDLAAMGKTRHRWAMIYLGVPPTVKRDFVMNIFSGIKDYALRYDCVLAGGDTVKARQISLVAAVGAQIASQKILKRTNAKPGDLLAVAGLVGDAGLGLRVLNGEPMKNAKGFVRNFFEHKPLFNESDILSREPAVTSAIDLSDSLSSSVDILTTASKVGAEVCLERIPRSKSFLSVCKTMDDIDFSGEDYGLLFTLKQTGFERLRNKMKFSVIGQITPSSNRIRYFLNGHPFSFRKGFRHF